jgi:Mrp family chromosome partitioning ATPase
MTDLYPRHLQSGARMSGVRDLIFGELESREATVPIVSLPKPLEADAVELVHLYNTVEEATETRDHHIIQFVSAGSEARNVEIAYNLAWIGATLLGKRILFVDASRNAKGGARWQPLRLSESQPRKGLQDVALGNASAEEAIVTEANNSLFVATLMHERTGGSAVLAAKQILTLLEELRTSFDMIVIAPPPTADQPLALMLKTVVDGSVLVAESGRSSTKALAKCAEQLSGGYGPLIGAVVRRARDPVPRWLRRWV